MYRHAASSLFVLLTIIYSGACAESCVSQVTPTSRSKSLKTNLFTCAYDSSNPPQAPSTNIAISFHLQTISLDEYEHTLYVHCWVLWEWTDGRLTWDPSSYQGLDLLHVFTSDIWVPKITHYNTRDRQSPPKTQIPYGKCQVTSSGKVSCVTRTVYTANSNPDFTLWPYDQINCTLQLNNLDDVNEKVSTSISTVNVSLESYQEDVVWRLVSATANVVIWRAESSIALHSVLFNILAERHSKLHEVLYGVPALVFFNLALVTFRVDLQDDNRIHILCTSLVCQTLHSMLLGYSMRYNSSEVPLIVRLYRDAMMLSAFSLIIAIVLRRLSVTTRTAPMWIQTSTSWVMKQRAAQVLLAGTTEVKTDEAEEAQEDQPTSVPNKEAWPVFVKLANCLCFLVIALLYLSSLLRFYI